MCQEALLAYETHCSQWPGCSKNNVSWTSDIQQKIYQVRYEDVFDMVAQMENSLTEVIQVATFCMSLTPFVQLPYDQKASPGHENVF